MDAAHNATDRRIAALEKRLLKLYEETTGPLEKRLEAYLKQFEKADAALRKKLDAGEITPAQYAQWRVSKIPTGDEFEAIREEFAEQMAEVNATATTRISEEMPPVYVENYNQERKDTGVTAAKVMTAAAAIALLRKPKLDRKKDLKWNRKQFTNAMVSGLQSGQPLTGRRGICVATVEFTVKRNSETACTNARTWLTTAENRGRQKLYDVAENLGFEVTKTWITQGDSRVRHAHRRMDGVTVPASEPFMVEGHPMKEPGDQSAPPHLYFNCRCYMKGKAHGSKRNRKQ